MSKLYSVLTVAIAAASAQAVEGAQQASGKTDSSHQSPTSEVSNQQTVGTPVGLGKTRVMSGTVDFIDNVNRRVSVKEADCRASRSIWAR